jgi:hypothetical protein
MPIVNMTWWIQMKIMIYPRSPAKTIGIFDKLQGKKEFRIQNEKKTGIKRWALGN